MGFMAAISNIKTSKITLFFFTFLCVVVSVYIELDTPQWNMYEVIYIDHLWIFVGDNWTE